MKSKTLISVFCVIFSSLAYCGLAEVPIIHSFATDAAVKHKVKEIGFKETADAYLFAFNIDCLTQLRQQRDASMCIYLDTDNNAMTGRMPKTYGWDYQLNIQLFNNDMYAVIWNGDTPTNVNLHKNYQITVDKNIYTISLPKSAVKGIKISPAFRMNVAYTSQKANISGSTGILKLNTVPQSQDNALTRQSSLKADPVDPAAALQSKIVTESADILPKYAADYIDLYMQTGKIGGQILFQDDFTDKAKTLKAWEFVMDVKFHDSAEGRSIRLTPGKKVSLLNMKRDSMIPVNPNHQIVAFCEFRMPRAGKPPRFIMEFFDIHRRPISVRQTRFSGDLSQPTIFARNAFHLNQWMPLNAAYFSCNMHLNAAPDCGEDCPAEVARLKIVDFDSAIKAKLVKISDARDFRALLKPDQQKKLPPFWQQYIKTNAKSLNAAADSQNIVNAISSGDFRRACRLSDVTAANAKGITVGEVLPYVADDISSSFPLKPDDFSLPGLPGAVLKIRECPGEMTRGSIFLWSPAEFKDVTVTFSPLQGKSGSIPASAMSAKIVKSHYQAEGAPASYVIYSTRMILMPDLMLNDDSLVIPDHNQKINLIKYQKDGKSWYVNINKLYTRHCFDRIPADVAPIRDASSLKPFHLFADRNKHLAVKFDVPKNAVAGKYSGKVTFHSAENVIAEVPVQLEVLPFRIPEKAATIYSPDCEYTMGLYYWGLFSPDGKAYLSPNYKSRQQLVNEIQLMQENGIKYPVMIWPKELVYNDAQFRKYLAFAREMGMKDDLYLGSSGYLGNSHDPKELEALKERVKHAMEIAREYGFNQIYFYGFDEAKAERLVAQLPAWRAARSVGAKVIVSGYYGHFQLVGKELDICIYANEPNTANPAEWHALGKKIWKYNTPQAGVENPNIFRRNFGLDIWKRGFDGGNTYCYLGYNLPWNDIADRLRGSSSGYRGLSMVYPTIDGVVETLAITGLHEAMKDIRYMTLFRSLLKKHTDAAAQKWFDSLDFETADLHKVRAETIDWILKLR